MFMRIQILVGTAIVAETIVPADLDGDQLDRVYENMTNMAMSLGGKVVTTH